MKLLLDTHALLWAAAAPEQLSIEARGAIEDGTNDVVVSPVSAWEIAIKQSLGKLSLPQPAERWLPEVLRKTSIEIVALDVGAALRVRSLPWHHRDPFDRLLAAQALDLGLTVVTRDAVFERYGVATLPA